jgi:hypothetical protein
MRGGSPVAHYNGYGSCPLTAAPGKIVLAEFGYGGTLLPSFPKAIIYGPDPRVWPVSQGENTATALMERHAQGPQAAGKTLKRLK